jgi:hypothetical protein
MCRLPDATVVAVEQAFAIPRLQVARDYLLARLKVWRAYRKLAVADAVSYQVKGRRSVHGRAGIVEAQEVYAGGPPIPGGRVP